jgi:ATP/ADP translocase
MWPVVLHFVAGFTAYLIFAGPEALMNMDSNKILHIVGFTFLGIFVLIGVSLFNQTKNTPPTPDPLAHIQPEKETVFTHSPFSHGD